METILCPTDFSTVADNAIRYAAELAQRMNSCLVLFHSMEKPVRNAAFRKVLENKLEAIKSSQQQTNWGMPIAYQTRISYGLPQDTILEAARQIQADMIVLGLDTSAGPDKILAGSIAAAVIGKAPCPVLVVPSEAFFKPIHQIVFATDLEGEPFTEVAFVSKLAGLFEARILFLHVLTRQARETRERALAELERLHKRFAYKNASYYTEVNSHVEEGISQFTRRHQADLLVMGFHPCHLLQPLLASDQVPGVAYHAFLPLLVIRYHR